MGGPAALADWDGRCLCGPHAGLLRVDCTCFGSNADGLLPAARRAVCHSRVLPGDAACDPYAARLARCLRSRFCPRRSARAPDRSHACFACPFAPAGSAGRVDGAAVGAARAAWSPFGFLNPRPLGRRFICYGSLNSGNFPMKLLFSLAALAAALAFGGVPASAATTTHAPKPAHVKVVVLPAAAAAAPSCGAGGDCCKGGKCCTMPGCCAADGSCCDPATGVCTAACGCSGMSAGMTCCAH